MSTQQTKYATCRSNEPTFTKPEETDHKRSLPMKSLPTIKALGAEKELSVVSDYLNQCLHLELSIHNKTILYEKKYGKGKRKLIEKYTNLSKKLDKTLEIINNYCTKFRGKKLSQNGGKSVPINLNALRSAISEGSRPKTLKSGGRRSKKLKPCKPDCIEKEVIEGNKKIRLDLKLNDELIERRNVCYKKRICSVCKNLWKSQGANEIVKRRRNQSGDLKEIVGINE